MQKIVSIAPMIGFTNSHFRTFMRLITKRATVYTEMVHMNAVVHNHEKVLPFSEI
jgi:tRNA-dihydrouridine synthase A